MDVRLPVAVVQLWRRLCSVVRAWRGGKLDEDVAATDVRVRAALPPEALQLLHLAVGKHISSHINNGGRWDTYTSRYLRGVRETALELYESGIADPVEMVGQTLERHNIARDTLDLRQALRSISAQREEDLRIELCAGRHMCDVADGEDTGVE